MWSPARGGLWRACAVALVVLALAPRAATADDRVLIWSIAATGGSDAGVLREQLYHSLAGGFAAAGLPVVPRAEVGRRLAPAPGLVGCETATCLRRVAELLAVSRLIRAHVEIFGSSYVFRVEYLGPDGRVRQRREGRCDVCTVSEVNEQISEVAVALARTPAATAPAPPPPPAPTPAAPAPSAAPAAPAAAAALPRAGSPDADHQRRPWLRRVPWKLVAVGASVAAFVVGASLLAIDGNGTCTPRTPGGACPRVYDTSVAGGTLTTIGLVGLLGSGAWVWLDRPTTPGSDRRATAAGVTVRLKF